MHSATNSNPVPVNVTVPVGGVTVPVNVAVNTIESEEIAGFWLLVTSRTTAACATLITIVTGFGISKLTSAGPNQVAVTVLVPTGRTFVGSAHALRDRSPSVQRPR